MWNRRPRSQSLLRLPAFHLPSDRMIDFITTPTIEMYRKKAIHKYHLLKSQSSSKLYVWRMDTPLLLFWNTLRSFSISSSMLRLSSSSLMIISTCPMLLWSLIFRYSSGLLSITKLFSIMFLKGLISFPRLSPKDFRDNIEKGAVISVFVGAISLSCLIGWHSFRTDDDCNDFLETISVAGSTC